MWLLTSSWFILYLQDLQTSLLGQGVTSHLLIASYQVLLQLQQGVCSGKHSIWSSYRPRSERKSWNTSKYFLRKADQCPQSMALRPITVTSAFLTMLGISSACLAPHTSSSCSEVLLLAASPNLTAGAWHKIGIFYIALRKMWNTGEMSDQNAYGRVKCKSTLCPCCKSRRKYLHCWNVRRAKECMCVHGASQRDTIMKKLIFLIQCGCQGFGSRWYHPLRR